MFFVPIFLGGCFGDGESGGTDVVTPGESLYSTSNFSIIYPSEWHILEKDTFPSLVPYQTILVFRNNIQNEVFTANVNISKMTVNKDTNVEDFSKSNLAKIKTTLLSVTEYTTKKTENGVIIHFRGRKSPTEPLVVFKSLNVIKNDQAYTVTGSYLPNEDEGVVIYIDKMLNSFSLK